MTFKDLLKHILPEDIILVDDVDNDEGYALLFINPRNLDMKRRKNEYAFSYAN